MKSLPLVIVIVCLADTFVNAGGFASSSNFVVQTAAEGNAVADRAYAQEVLRQATRYRNQIAEEWLGAEIPPSIGRTHLTVLVTDSADSGRMWPKNDLRRRYHNIHLSTSRQAALGGTLAHEIAHLVLATRYPEPHPLPPWVSEGIASRYDEGERVVVRQQIFAWYASTGNWPRIKTLLALEVIPSSDRESYTLAASITEFLLTKGDKQKLLDFASLGARDGWDFALSSFYDIQNVGELESQWREWAKSSVKAAGSQATNKIRPSPALNQTALLARESN